MGTGLILASTAVAAAAAVRSTWSPCGLSMLSTITPVAERGRGHRYWGTATWFVLGGILGGFTLGAGAAGLAAIVATLGLAVDDAIRLAVFAGVVAFASDLRVLGFRVPGHMRQVNDAWLAQFRPWVYGLGFGWQIGVGIATYIMTSGVYLMIVLAALTGNPAFALVLMTGFGFVRGLAVLAGSRLTTPAAVFAFHRRFDALAPTTRTLMIAIEGTTTLMLAVALAGLPMLLVAAVIAMNLPGLEARRAAAAAVAD